jgi:hypothetical protein
MRAREEVRREADFTAEGAEDAERSKERLKRTLFLLLIDSTSCAPSAVKMSVSCALMCPRR